MTDKKEQKDSIIFYCKDCEKIVETVQFGRKFVYKCKKCGTKNVAFGTEKSIFSFFRLDPKKLAEEEKGSKEPKKSKDDGKK